MKGIGNRQKKIVAPRRVQMPAGQRPSSKKPKGGKENPRFVNRDS